MPKPLRHSPAPRHRSRFGLTIRLSDGTPAHLTFAGPPTPVQVEQAKAELERFREDLCARAAEAKSDG